MLDTFTIDLTGVIVPENLPFFKTKTENPRQLQRCFYATAEQYKKIGYFPTIFINQLKTAKGWFTQRITIQASAPKLVNGNSVFGIDELDYDKVIAALLAVLAYVGLGCITAQHLHEATLRQVAFCFCFFFPAIYPYPREYLKKLAFLDVGRRFDGIKNTEYIEETEGYSGKMYNTQVGFGLYDKAAQTINDRKTESEFELAGKLKNRQFPDNILRLEVTYQNQTSLKKHLATRIGGTEKQTRYLKEVFNNQLSQRVLSEYFEVLASDINVEAFEMPLVPIERAYRLGKAAGLSFWKPTPGLAGAFLSSRLVHFWLKTSRLKLTQVSIETD